ncbi:hypothetical protein ATANTOWER_016274 [Ataeniobius toweri]|uniref:Uncharacterized protein n=1 Tax=Ataeniobius toweri TaxID=208326 RepID=A0ABU7ARR5_9TELE|nr:hypothetical protein [Ataeniobius toweri]
MASPDSSQARSFASDLMVPISCLRSPTGQPQPIGLLLQPDNITKCRCQPPDSGITAVTGTANFTTTATGSSINIRGGEQSTQTLSLQPPPEYGQSSPGGGS